MGVFRSEVILHKKIRIPQESVMEVMDALGKLETDSIEFIDLNKDNLEAKKNFAEMIQRCEDMDRKINNFEIFSQEFNETVIYYKRFSHFLNDLQQDVSTRDKIFGTYFDSVENEILEEEKRFIELVDSFTKIKENLETLVEKKCVFDKSHQLINTNPELSIHLENDTGHSHNMLEEGHHTGFQFLAGVIKADDDLKMKRMIFRASKGTALPTFFDFVNNDIVNEKEPNSTTIIKKRIFTIFFQGGQENFLLHKLLKICDLFGASRYNIPRRNEITNQVRDLQYEINEKKNFLREAEISIKKFLRERMGNEIQPGKLEMYKLYFKKEKLLHQNLNKCLLHEHFIDGEVWILEKDFPKLKAVLRELNTDESRIPASFIDLDEANILKPTYIPSNEVLWPFQEIVNTYGVPRYMEINPTYFNIVTFPFLFGVMFGDIGHGLILLIFGLYLCFNAESIKQDPKSSLKIAVKSRYLLLLMGIFAFYCGWIYNDFISVPIPLFGTCYKDNLNVKIPKSVRTTDCVYPFGIDPKWKVSTNELSYVNSFKMKLSVILGVSHMILGIIMKGLNDIHFKNGIGFIFEFIPQLLFMSMLFGYMNIMIFIKWATNWANDLSKAPSLIAQMMNIFLKIGSVNGLPLWGNKDGNSYSQEKMHKAILIISLVLIPIMLLPKPIILYFRKKKHQSDKSYLDNLSDEQKLSFGNDNRHVSHLHKDLEDDQEHSFGEIFIHQSIEIIEFVLGSVSNTASYLRLWALSLAHAELSKVFFEKTLLAPISNGDYISGLFEIFIGFFVFANITFFVLLCMDFMECFLHTLRLHWVEFQNKFFKADGFKFQPYSFKCIVQSNE